MVLVVNFHSRPKVGQPKETVQAGPPAPARLETPATLKRRGEKNQIFPFLTSSAVVPASVSVKDQLTCLPGSSAVLMNAFDLSLLQNRAILAPLGPSLLLHCERLLLRTL